MTDDFDDLIKRFSQTMATWKQQLKRYSYQELCTQPDPESWSIGQVVLHLIEETNWYMDQLSVCLESDENKEEAPTDNFKNWLAQNGFPNKRFKGPADLPTPPQPGSKEALLDQFNDLISRVRNMGKLIEETESVGRAPHPGHGYLNAREWFQYAEMHMRHHFRQKDRIEAFLYD